MFIWGTHPHISEKKKKKLFIQENRERGKKCEAQSGGETPDRIYLSFSNKMDVRFALVQVCCHLADSAELGGKLIVM